MRPLLLRMAPVVLITGLAACGGSDASVEKTPLPNGFAMHLDQARTERKGREVFVRVENTTRRALTIERFELRSPRWDDTEWVGPETIDADGEADLELNLPPSRCGAAVDAAVDLTYRLDGGKIRRSTASADDIYGAVTLLADRDCAELTLRKAADLRIGEATVRGEGSRSVLDIPVTLTPTGGADDVTFGGFGSTVLFRQAGGSPSDVATALRAGQPPVELTMSVVPSRCDPHALAEDKVGTLFDVEVDAPGLADNASFYLPLGKQQRSALFAFFRFHCGLA